jgi:hypothetical protein
MLLNPFCPLTTAKVLALKATVLLLMTLLIKAKMPGVNYVGGRLSNRRRTGFPWASHAGAAASVERANVALMVA